VDGDTIRVDVGGEVFRLRYIGIDAPDLDQWMGAEARAANEQLVSGQTVYLEKDVSETDKYGRLLRYVYLADEMFVNAELVRRGYARAKSYEPDVERQGVLQQAEQQAREDGLGLWGSTPVPSPAPSGQARVVVAPSCCQFNSPGDDNNTKEQEYVCFANTGSGDADMSGWMVSDEYGWTYTFPGFVLPAGAYVRVATGCGNNTADTLFWCKDGTAVWNNGGDTVSLYDNTGTLVARYSY
jgi:micrococcal nuclease